eukprot:2982640-Amphidinium_carterae.1
MCIRDRHKSGRRGESLQHIQHADGSPRSHPAHALSNAGRLRRYEGRQRAHVSAITFTLGRANRIRLKSGQKCRETCTARRVLEKGRTELTKHLHQLSMP